MLGFEPRSMDKTWFFSLYHAAHAWASLSCELQQGCFLELRLELCEINSLADHRASLGSWPRPPSSEHHQ